MAKWLRYFKWRLTKYKGTYPAFAMRVMLDKGPDSLVMCLTAIRVKVLELQKGVGPSEWAEKEIREILEQYHFM